MRNLTQILIALVMLTVSSYSYSFCDGPATLTMCDTDVDSDIDVHDISAIGLAKGTPSSGPGDVRDVDGDGMITVLDARQCVSRCTLPECADPDESSITTPGVVGLSQAAAESDIVGAGLVVGSVTTASSDTVPAGNVISQDPAGGSSVAAGSPVDLVVSSGSALITTPGVVGLSQAAAESDIVGAGLVVGSVTTASSDTVPAGNVISQDPSGGVAVAGGTAVDIVVSSGAPTIPVPDVVNLSQTAAEDDILGAGLVVGTIVTESSATVPEGQVISQTPAAGLVVALNTSVDLVVSTGAVAEPGFIDGPAGGIAVEYIELVTPTASPSAALGEEFVFDRLLVSIEPDATVAEVNDALLRHDARVSTSVPNTFRVTVRIDQQISIVALNSKAAAMRAEAAFYDVDLSARAELSELPIFADKSDISTFEDQLSPYLPSKFPAVWNLRDRMLRTGDTLNTSIVVTDHFPQSAHPELPDLVPLTAAGSEAYHGLGVTGVIAAGYDGTGLTGVTPVEPGNPILLLNFAPFGITDALVEISRVLPETGDLLVNASWGYPGEGSFSRDQLLTPALDALYVKAVNASHVGRISYFIAAGNNEPPLPAATGNPYSIARSFDNPCEVVSDPPESLPLTPEDKAYCEAQRAKYAGIIGPFIGTALPNISLVGSALSDTEVSVFSSTGYDVAAVGEGVITACVDIPTDKPCMPFGPVGSVDITAPLRGTSFSAPQITGLAFVMRRLRADAPLDTIRSLIVASAQDSGTKLVNAYRAVLELDRVAPGGGALLSGLDSLTVENSVRGGLLDVRAHADADTPMLDDAFTEVDLEAFIDAFIGDPLDEIDGEPGERNFSRFDLNGDEKTGGPEGARFDLNNDGDFTTAAVVIGGESFTYDETNVTDGNILCYMTFGTDFYEGSPEYRDIVFALFGADLCVPLDYALDVETSLEITDLSLPDFWVYTSPGAPVVLDDIIPNRDPITSYRGNYRAPAGSNCFFGERGSPRHSLAATLAGGNFYIPDVTNAPYANNFGPVKDGCSNFIAFENGAAWINVTRRLDRRSGSFIFENESQMRISVPKSTGLGERTGFIEFYFMGTQTDTGAPMGDFDLDFQLELKFTSS